MNEWMNEWINIVPPQPDLSLVSFLLANESFHCLTMKHFPISNSVAKKKYKWLQNDTFSDFFKLRWLKRRSELQFNFLLPNWQKKSKSIIYFRFWINLDVKRTKLSSVIFVTSVRVGKGAECRRMNLISLLSLFHNCMD